MFARMRDITEETMVNTEMFYARDAADRVVALFRSFGGDRGVTPDVEGDEMGQPRPCKGLSKRKKENVALLGKCLRFME
jgi:hypothetical protein